MIGIRSYRTFWLHVSFAVVAVIALARCTAAGTRTFAGSSASADAEVARHVKRGYVSDRSYPTVTVNDAWTIDGEAVAVSLMLPAGDDRFPLVVYLPGLGETTESGLAWRKAWAEAGYAVLCVQPASDGVAVWKSEQARLGDFQAIARMHFAASSLARRVRLLEGIFAELTYRSAVSSPFARVDTRAIAVTGFGRAPFRYMPAGDKYLLILAGAPHSLMSGRETPDTATTQSETGEGAGMGPGEERPRSGMRGRRGRGAASGLGMNASGAPSVSGNCKMEVADAKSVSTAFLDASVKADPVAREWLQKDAQRWLGDLAQISSK